ncbi:hypothetical protein HAX54_022145, partial [Datura stramonium]|nr:hypothetical protein [Datura stramonium]
MRHVHLDPTLCVIRAPGFINSAVVHEALAQVVMEILHEEEDVVVDSDVMKPEDRDVANRIETEATYIPDPMLTSLP